MENQNKNQNKKKVYMTKKRKAKILKCKAITLLIVTGTLAGIIGIQAQKLNNDIDELSNQPIVTQAEKKETIEVIEVVSETIREVTAYNVGDPNQTDDSPCIGAYSKVNLCEEVAKGVGVCASNFVPLGTHLQIIAGNGWSMECVVWDRMNSRYTNRVDIAMNYWEKDRAIKFGLQNLTVRILGDRETIIK